MLLVTIFYWGLSSKADTCLSNRPPYMGISWINLFERCYLKVRVAVTIWAKVLPDRCRGRSMTVLKDCVEVPYSSSFCRFRRFSKINRGNIRSCTFWFDTIYFVKQISSLAIYHWFDVDCFFKESSRLPHLGWFQSTVRTQSTRRFVTSSIAWFPKCLTCCLRTLGMSQTPKWTPSKTNWIHF